VLTHTHTPTHTPTHTHTHKQSQGAKVSGLAAYGPPAQEDADPFPLRWGEVIPLYFLTPFLPSQSRIMVISQPSRRYTDSVAMIPELLTLGGWWCCHGARAPHAKYV